MGEGEGETWKQADMFDTGGPAVITVSPRCDSEMAERHSNVEDRSPLLSQGAQVGKERIPRFAVSLEKAVEDTGA